ncbi:hypothetical protein JCM19297_2511 [Nonlabens ulvanivorans]|nr:hypothetical protein JCM19297_2511 [Nonlabens ulvanivorans]
MKAHTSGIPLTNGGVRLQSPTIFIDTEEMYHLVQQYI